VPPRAVDLTGKQYGEWTVLARAYRNKARQWCWMCQCTCGTLEIVRGNNLVSGDSRGCRGCRTYGKSVRSAIPVSWGGRTMTFKEWADTLDQPMGRMYQRLYAGWTLTECLTTGTDPVLLELLGLDDTCQAEQVSHHHHQPTEST